MRALSYLTVYLTVCTSLYLSVPISTCLLVIQHHDHGMQEFVTLSADDTADPEDIGTYPHNFLHTLTPADHPAHELHLKVGMPVMLIRNLDQSEGNCKAYGTIAVIQHITQPWLYLLPCLLYSACLTFCLLLTFNAECRLVFTPVGEALSRPVLGVHLFCVGTVRRDMLRSIWI